MCGSGQGHEAGQLLWLPEQREGGLAIRGHSTARRFCFFLCAHAPVNRTLAQPACLALLARPDTSCGHVPRAASALAPGGGGRSFCGQDSAAVRANHRHRGLCGVPVFADQRMLLVPAYTLPRLDADRQDQAGGECRIAESADRRLRKLTRSLPASSAPLAAALTGAEQLYVSQGRTACPVATADLVLICSVSHHAVKAAVTSLQLERVSLAVPV